MNSKMLCVVQAPAASLMEDSTSCVISVMSVEQAGQRSIRGQRST